MPAGSEIDDIFAAKGSAGRKGKTGTAHTEDADQMPAVPSSSSSSSKKKKKDKKRKRVDDSPPHTDPPPQKHRLPETVIDPSAAKQPPPKPPKATSKRKKLDKDDESRFKDSRGTGPSKRPHASVVCIPTHSVYRA